MVLQILFTCPSLSIRLFSLLSGTFGGVFLRHMKQKKEIHLSSAVSQNQTLLFSASISDSVSPLRHNEKWLMYDSRRDWGVCRWAVRCSSWSANNIRVRPGKNENTPLLLRVCACVWCSLLKIPTVWGKKIKQEKTAVVFYLVSLNRMNILAVTHFTSKHKHLKRASQTSDCCSLSPTHQEYATITDFLGSKEGQWT